MFRKKRTIGIACFFVAFGMLFMLFLESKIWGMLLAGVLLLIGYFCLSCDG